MDSLEDLVRDAMRRHESDAPNPTGLLAGVASRERSRRHRLAAAAAAGTVAAAAGVVLTASLIGGGQQHEPGPAGNPSTATDLPDSDVIIDLSSPVTTTSTGSGVVTIGAAPPGADRLRIKLICLTSGTFTLPEGPGMTCSAADAAAGIGVETSFFAFQPGQKTLTIRTSPASRWRVTTTFIGDTSFGWGINKAGQTFGVPNANGTPTLVAVVATNGKAGYVYDRDLHQPALATPSQALAGQRAAPGEVSLAVYTSDGTTVVGTFLLGANVATGSTTAAAPGTTR
jgi:hypothetical protein